jgi:predicted DCC family thiol-disulfide oxidoreductase YuxK
MRIEMPSEWLDGLTIVYDGDCPFCSRYVEFSRIRSKFGQVRLINAREHDAFARYLKARGLDLNSGMLVHSDGISYFGADAISFLSRNNRSPGLFAINPLAKAIYQLLRFGRLVTLRLLLQRPL